MAGQSNAAPVVIKRKKIVAGGGHHGGAWKVAYADFVTAMMAFFMLMWLLNATTEKQRKGLADYFNPAVPISRISGGGEGAMGGDSVLSEQTLAQTGTGATMERPAESDRPRGDSGTAESDSPDQAMRAVEQRLTARGGESMTMERLLRHVITRVTDEGLVIELFDLPDSPLFQEETAQPTAITAEIAGLLADVLSLATNRLAVEGYVHSYPITLIENPAWPLSAARAQALRAMIEAKGLAPDRFARITGHADRAPVTADPTVARNNRVEVVLLRRDR
ncbi:MAG: flagellar motor protein MotB [Paracoccaceae bacterium]